MAITQNTRINTLIMRGLSATEATAQAQREARRQQEVKMTTHKGGGYVIHADARWVNGNSPVGLALAVRQHKAGKPVVTDVAGGAHVVHPAGETCGYCPAGT